jgi:hypothetical protein
MTFKAFIKEDDEKPNPVPDPIKKVRKPRTPKCNMCRGTGNVHIDIKGTSKVFDLPCWQCEAGKKSTNQSVASQRDALWAGKTNTPA